ncbi:efflux RND transporter permease subunit [Symmachiella dynata]|uniref:efflux RND transporter permease subunit n=1 Tax=Symmachiella dynata TaxID=2527995 RepID=UPI0030ED6DB3
MAATDAPRPEPNDSPRLSRFVDFLIRHRIALFLYACVAVAAGIVPASQLTFDQSIESLYAKNNPHLMDYLHSKKLFGGDEFVVLAYTDPELLADEGLDRLELFVEKLEKIEDVVSIQDLAASMKVGNIPLLDENEILDLYRGLLIGEDEQTTAVILRLQSLNQAKRSRAETIATIRDVAKDYQFPVHIVGEPVQVHDMFRYVEEDGETLGLWSSVLLIGVILLFFRSLRWVALPILIVHATLIWTKAILVLSGMQLSMVSSMLTSLITIIGVATSIHLTVHFRERRKHADRTEALRQTFIDLGPAIFWTCATTAVGFAALLSSHITPVQSFGIMMALGAMLVLVAAATLLPGGILIGSFSPDPHYAPAEKRLGAGLEHVTNAIERRPRLLGFAALALTLFALAGFMRLRVETDFSKNFRDDSVVVRDLNFVENRLGGSGTWEVNFPAPFADEELDEEFLDRVRDVADQLNALDEPQGETETESEPPRPMLTKVLSLPDGFDVLPDSAFFVSVSLERKRKIMDSFQPEFETTLYNPEQGRMRIMLRARERQQSDAKLRAIDQVTEITAAEFGEANATGLFVLLTFLIESLLSDQITSFVLAAIGITTMMTIAFRSLKIGLICLVPNVFPIIIVIGLMGWGGVPINIATAMIASVSMGLTVDSSVHYIAGFRRAQARGLDVNDALRATHQGVGKALVFANIALILGFSVLTLSHFIPLIYFGVLVSVAMLGGLIGNLVLLPLLLRLAEGQSMDDVSSSEAQS